MRRIFSNGRYANVTATLGLIVALGGTSYAAVTLPKNSVTSKELRNGGVKGRDLARGSITTRAVKDGSLLAHDFKAGQIPQGEKGEKGDKGDTGDTGAFASVTVQETTATVDLADGAKQSYDAFCPAGQQAIGGGGRGDDTNSEETNVSSSRPVISTGNTGAPIDGGTFTGWRLTVTNVTGGAAVPIRPTVWVACVPAPTT